MSEGAKEGHLGQVIDVELDIHGCKERMERSVEIFHLMVPRSQKGNTSGWWGTQRFKEKLKLRLMWTLMLVFQSGGE